MEGEKSYARIKGNVDEVLNAVNAIFDTFAERDQTFLEITQLVALLGSRAEKIPKEKIEKAFSKLRQLKQKLEGLVEEQKDDS